MTPKTVIIAISGAMTILIAALLGLSAHRSDPFGRYRQFMAAHPVFRASFTTNSGGGTLTGSLLIDRPKRFLYTASLGRDGFVTSSTEKGMLQIDKRSRTYDEMPPMGIVTMFSSRISSAPEAIPAPLMGVDLAAYVPKNPTISSEADGDHIHSTFKGPTGTAEVWATVNKTGELTFLHVKEVSLQHSRDESWKISYDFPQKITPGDFSTQLPLGYLPYALDRETFPIQKGKTLPLKGWSLRGSGATVDLTHLAGGRPFLLAILDQSPPSEKAAGSLKALSARLPVLVVGNGTLSDPSGNLLAKINAPGTPTFFLATGTGKVLKLWYGFDANRASEFQKDVLSSLKSD